MSNSRLLSGFLACLLVSTGAAADIYKNVDENGNVTFSDQPSAGAERIEKREIPTVSSEKPKVDFNSDDEDTGAGDGKKGSQNGFQGYDSIEIVSPEGGGAIHSNGGSLSVNINVQPSLQQGHSIVLYMDGSEARRGRSSAFQFANVDRGQHTLTAAIETDAGEEVARSGNVTFTLLRQSRLHPETKTPGTEQAPRPDGPTPTNPPSGQPSGQNPVSPSFDGPTPTNPPKPSPSS